MLKEEILERVDQQLIIKLVARMTLHQIHNKEETNLISCDNKIPVMGEDKMLQESQIKDLVIKLKGMAGKVMLP